MAIEGLDRLLHQLDSLPHALEIGARRGLRQGAAEILTEAQARVPVVTGHLRDSGHLIERADGFDIAFDAPYGVYVHENPHSRGFKFLEGPTNEAADRVPHLAGAEADRELSRVGRG